MKRSHAQTVQRSHKHRTSRQFLFEELESRCLLATNVVTFERFSINDGPGAAALYQSNPAAGTNTATCFSTEGVCPTAGSNPAWSPDGAKLLYISATGGLVISNADGTQTLPIQTADGSTVRGLTPTWVGLANAAISYAWTADNQQNTNFDILYATLTYFEDRVVASAPINLTNHSAGDFSPSWNSAGTSLVFESYRADGAGDIFRLDNPLSPDAVLTNLTVGRVGIGDFKPDWSSDGTKIVFAGNDGRSDLWVMNADGTNVTRLTNDTFNDDMPSWSPDGSQIAFSSSRGTEGDLGQSLDPEIFLINADGTGLTPLTSNENEIFEWNPEWRPIPSANLTLDIRDAVDPIPEGGVADYRIRVHNGGFSPATGIKVVTDPIPAHFIYDPAANPPEFEFTADRRVVIHYPDLLAGSGFNFQLKITITRPGLFFLNATVTANEEDPHLENNTATESTTTARASDAIITVRPSSPRTTNKEALRYTVELTNPGPSAAQNLDVSATLPRDVLFSSTTSTFCSGHLSDLACHFDTLEPGNRLIVNFIVIPLGQPTADITISTTFKLTVHDSIELNLDNNEHTVNTVFEPAADTDGDGLFDAWELRGIDVNYDMVVDLDLPALKADPRHKDIFVEVDYMSCEAGGCPSGIFTNERPKPGVFTDVTKAFANAPVDNPDGRDGISLHVQLDEAMYHNNLISFGTRGPGHHDDFYDYKIGSDATGNPGRVCGVGTNDAHFGLPSERLSSNCSNIISARRLVYRYAVFGVEYSEYRRSSGVAEMPGNDFMVTVGGWGDYGVKAAGGETDLDVARQILEAGTFMHELGHTLGLDHGGGDALNRKPNYLSVMNYDLTNRDIDPNRALDYSRQKLPLINERDLDEPLGIQGPTGRNTVRHAGKRNIVVPADKPIDWNDNNDATDLDVTLDLNGNNALNILDGYDDWANLVYDFRESKDYADGPKFSVPSDEDGTEAFAIERAQNTDFDADQISNADDNCPSKANPDQSDLDGDGVGDVCEPTDVNPPQLTGVPTNVMLLATSREGAMVTFVLPTATDDLDTSPDVDCDFTSGGLLAVGRSREVVCTAVDHVGNEATGSFQISVRSPWQNGNNPPDVNRDGKVQPIDALLVINELNGHRYSTSDGQLPIPTELAGLALDVSGEGMVFPIDALLVINAIARGQREPEGLLMPTPMSIPAAASEPNDESLRNKKRGRASGRTF